MPHLLLLHLDSFGLPPETLGLEAARVQRLRADEGVSLVAWFVPGQVISGKARRLLFLYGIGEPTARGSVLAIGSRGFGGSNGTPSKAGLTPRRAGCRHLRPRGAGFAAHESAVVGESLGSRLAPAQPDGGVVLAGACHSVVAVVFPDRHGFGADLASPSTNAVPGLYSLSPIHE